MKLLDSLPLLDQEPRYLGKLIDNVHDYVNWDKVEYCVNNPQFYPVEIIKNNKKIFIPKYECAWHNTAIFDKKFIVNKINQGNSFVILNYSYNNKHTLNLMKEISNKFDVFPDIHIYGGLSGSTSFEKHRDTPPNIIIQVEGETPWKVWKDPDSDPVIDLILKPGEALYIPANIYHIAEPNGQRLSMSIPCWTKQNTESSINHTDRNFYKINHF
jgi:hypothetical protein